AVALACEAGFTLLAVPVLGRLGAWGVSLHAVWIAALMLAALGLVGEGLARFVSCNTNPELRTLVANSSSSEPPNLIFKVAWPAREDRAFAAGRHRGCTAGECASRPLCRAR
ncbi:MAG TPA: hypothetical protein PK867_01725, partial [Pirellulales bacterium]|nr:hypothetical protein [Pirellulales bacterium]